MGSMEELNKILHKSQFDEYDAAKDLEEKRKKEYFDAIQKRKIDEQFPLKKIAFELALAKKIICHCMSNLYISSLIIDNPEKYSDSLKNAMSTQCMECMKDVKTMKELNDKLKNASPYLKSMIPLAESIMDTKTDEDIKATDDIDNIILSKDDIKLIEDFENIEGKNSYAEGIQDRVVDVYKAEQKMGEDRNEKVQNIVDDLIAINEKKEGTLTEAIEQGLGAFNEPPKTIFNAIFINKGKHVLNEAGSGTTIEEQTKNIIAETICTYTLLECIHSLGLKTFSYDDKINLRNEFYAG
jgi:hypothetical protein